MQKKLIMLLVGGALLGGCSSNHDNSNSLLETTLSEENSEDTEVGTEIETTTPETPLNPSKKYKIYINPSVQINNIYAGGFGSEAKNMRDIGVLMVEGLSKYPHLEVKGNCAVNGLSLTQSVRESNAFGADIHLALHTNAGGGKGSEIFYAGDMDFAKIILDDFLTLGSFANRGVKSGSGLYEVKNSKAPATALMEFLFHDDLSEATFIANNKVAIAEKMNEAILRYVATLA